MQNIFSNFSVKKNLIERSIAEIRRGTPVLLYYDTSYLLVVSSELINVKLLKKLTSFSNNVYLLLTTNRLNYIFSSNSYTLSRIPANHYTIDEIYSLLTGHNGSIITLPDKNKINPSTNILDKCAISLIKSAKLLPSALVIDINFKSYDNMVNWCNNNGMLYVHKNILNQKRNNYSIKEVCSSSLVLQDCCKSKIIIYRSNIGELEHYAIIIGEPDFNNPLVRIHSSCYTGDLLGSLSCDCRNQLHTAMKLMQDNQGGIILYLAQDGRGIGLVNKIRTYQLQTENYFDTVDANRFLGFEDDERIFIPAVAILEKLGISKLQLMTNNPRKASEIKKHGFHISKILPIIANTNKYNINYINTKINRLGHVS
ncbi:GTP cyclohydrolase II RibA [Neoehrlichia mikurensis]|uniref:GTP cyclohydrolase II n=1 Tax=Neoehrlichia mikurensis TaxID=89586 RepID=A0A9Q9F414_9RICK|nr:GTP cyclohydrolase II [Neoehrlichia mikurensis]QXK92308.1 GTP cyclohydrolase II RibA [Neoehrlichia mikurensis]QXK92762.1 GTP cyclohydrolase II RibA [Neoehrlichia mikurensis]QXK94003.1 GTP cyclohydrolase II RibA [Neoehrlichia mikurensis]UTO55834.1 GTP cyclohydrolase II RibA [Neoehrlichia mikurensis]UTO56749.1 GTP cyclohydrolase II RibA [Neoehrlichia mikurensis]